MKQRFGMPLWAGMGLVLIQVVLSALLFNLGPTRELLAKFDYSLIDSVMGQSGADIYAALEAYGEQGRAAYARYIRGYDFFYALISAVAFGGFLMAMSSRVKWWPRWLIVLPIPALILDVIENIGLLTLITNYPQQLIALADRVGMVTTLKVALVYILYLSIPIGIVTLIIQWVRKR